MELNPELLQIGTIGILFLIAIKEFFAYLKTKKSGNGKNGNDKVDSSQNSRIAVVETKIDLILDNHFPHLEARQERLENKVDLILEKMMDLKT